MKERAAYQASSAGQQTADSSGGAGASAPVDAFLENDKARPSADAVRSDGVDGRAKKGAASPAGLTFPRFFTEAGVDPFDEVDWDLRAAVIGNERGEIVFEQRDVEIPASWSQQATNIVVSKYFRGQIGSPERERSVRQLIGRVVNTITEWGRVQKYFASDDDLRAFSDDLKHILVYQKAAFNTPLWFNCGFE
jgi:ribonucleoside-diphosphate reductase alpha chain